MLKAESGDGASKRLLGTPALWHSILLRQGLTLPEADQNSPMLHRPLAAGVLHAQQVRLNAYDKLVWHERQLAHNLLLLAQADYRR